MFSSLIWLNRVTIGDIKPELTYASQNLVGMSKATIAIIAQFYEI